MATIESAGPGDLTFLANPKYAGALASTRATAVIAAPGVDAPCAVIRTAEPYLTLARAAQVLSPDTAPEPGVHPLAVVDARCPSRPDGRGGPVRGDRRWGRVGARTAIGAHAVVGAARSSVPTACCTRTSQSASGCTLGARVVVQNGAVIGSDGFGFAPRADGTHEDSADRPRGDRRRCRDRRQHDDRSARGGRDADQSGTKIDNLVQIAHGVIVGHNVLLAAQVGIAGSSVLGDRVMIGGQVGVTGHLTMGDGLVGSAKSGITNSVEPGVVMSGYPARRSARGGGRTPCSAGCPRCASR